MSDSRLYEEPAIDLLKCKAASPDGLKVLVAVFQRNRPVVARRPNLSEKNLARQLGVRLVDQVST